MATTENLSLRERATKPRPAFRLVPLLEPRQKVGETRRIAVYAASLGLAALLSVLLLAVSGVPPSDLGTEIAATAFSSPRALGSVLAQMAPLVVAGLATAIAFRANFWNIGLEGQMILGAICATAIAIFDIGPEALRLPLMMLAACAGGMGWIAGPAYLRQKLGVSEVITTLLLNYVAFNLLLHLLYGGWKDPVSSFPHSEQYEAVERLPQLGWQTLTWALPFAGILAAALWWILSASRLGYLLDLLSANRDMARAVGVPVAGLSLAAILASGAVAGLTGFVISAGIEGRMTQDFHVGYLFNGVLIAFLGRNHPLGVVIAAFFMAVLVQVGQSLQVFFGTPFSLVRLTQAIFIICVAGSEFFLTYRMNFRSAS
ncbi:ABC transporter permease [Aquicoccus sp. SCR17]|nr:ABC transporter permease [Carideicomes alvinocaridis]